MGTTANETRFTSNPAIKGREESYITLSVNLETVLKSWRHSLYAFEWLDEKGAIKPFESLPESEKSRYLMIETAFEKGQPLEQPVLGIGLMDNVEIGAGKAVLLTLAAHKVKTMPVHIPKSHRDDFRPFLA
ncbi:MAG: hypothetical protein H6868_01290 [Rhodospirillales bacterium]|nr:hypothetical protein [Rhodospirillales bacterium]